MQNFFNKFIFLCLILLVATFGIFAQSGKVKTYSESKSEDNIDKTDVSIEIEKADLNKTTEENEEIININTELVIIPTQVSTKKGKAVLEIEESEFKIFENNIEQEISFFSDTEQPFTVALLLDMSYSSVFKLEEIRNAALTFINQLRDKDKVTVISFDEEVRILCKPTTNRKVLRLAIEGTRVASGTSLYSALNLSLSDEFKASGRKAIVLLSDGVDTTSRDFTAEQILEKFGETDVLVYPIQYDTYSDVQKSRKDSAMIIFDEEDRPIIARKPKIKGEREEDYKTAKYFLKDISESSGGRIHRVSSTTNLNAAFSNIANELRKIYSLGYYPKSIDENVQNNQIKVRVYRPNLIVRSKSKYIRNRTKQ